MTKEEFENLKKGDLVMYVGNKANRSGNPRYSLVGLIMEVSEIKDIVNNEDRINIKTWERVEKEIVYRAVTFKQPYIESDFRLTTASFRSLKLVNK